MPPFNRDLHSWDLSPSEAIALQKELSAKVVLEDRLGKVRRVAGLDVGFEDDGAVTRAAVAVLSYPGLEPLEEAVAERPTEWPYIPGLLSFREVPALLDALEKLQTQPDLLLCDSQGIAHQRRFGLACHIGLITGIPALGVAKSRLVGNHEPVPGAKGSRVPLIDGDETVGMVLRTRDRVKPVYVSPGHKISLPTACDYVMGCLTRYRLPETTRRADRLASNR